MSCAMLTDHMTPGQSGQVGNTTLQHNISLKKYFDVQNTLSATLLHQLQESRSTWQLSAESIMWPASTWFSGVKVSNHLCVILLALLVANSSSTTMFHFLSKHSGFQRKADSIDMSLPIAWVSSYSEKCVETLNEKHTNGGTRLWHQIRRHDLWMTHMQSTIRSWYTHVRIKRCSTTYTIRIHW